MADYCSGRQVGAQITGQVTWPLGETHAGPGSRGRGQPTGRSSCSGGENGAANGHEGDENGLIRYCKAYEDSAFHRCEYAA